MTVRLESDGSRSHWTLARMDSIRAALADQSGFTLQGTVAVGDGTVQMTDRDKPCVYVRICAPTADHDAGANTGNILIGTRLDSPGNAVGGIGLTPTNYVGLDYPCTNVNQVHLTGFNAGDVVEYQVFGFAK